MKVQKCKDCVNHLTYSCPFYMNFFNDYMNDLIAENGRMQFGINCFQSEEDKLLCDMMCGEAEDEY